MKERKPFDKILEDLGVAPDPDQPGDLVAPAPIPAEILERFKVLGEDPDRFPVVLKRRGIPFLLAYLKRREGQLAVFREWSPKLHEFAADCRLRNPCPDADSLDARDRAKLLLYEDKIQTAERIRPLKSRREIICTIPLAATSLAQRLWPGEAGAIILTGEELSQWGQIYKHPEDAPEWWVSCWWKIQDPPDANFIRNRGLDVSVPEGTQAWIVEQGQWFGSLASSRTRELWSWDGHQAKFVRALEHLIS